MILRILGVAALSLFLLTDATAQSQPGKRRAAKRSQPTGTIPASKTMIPGAGAVMPSRTSEATPAAERMATDEAPMRAAEETKDHGNVYAAPGQPVHVPDGKVAPYDGPAAKERKAERVEMKARETNTLSPAK